MCRFLIIKSKTQINLVDILNQFALACEKSIAPDGERQRDGFGNAWRENGKWNNKKSLLPIWEEENVLKDIPETSLLVVHARGSGFEKDRGIIDYNEPFIEGDICFVFNGMIRGVKIKRKLEGRIGSQKIFSLTKEKLDKRNSKEVLEYIKTTVLNNSEKIEGMNIGLVDDEEITALCQYSDNKDYYTLNYCHNTNLIMISSEAFGDYDWKQFKRGEVKTFK